MPLIIRHRQVIADNWRLLETAADGSAAMPASVAVLVPLATWLAQRDALVARGGQLGVWLDSHEDPASIAGDFASLNLIAVNFPHFTDGRGYSIARLLRERHGWRGELRAIGDVLRDQLFYLARCGFDSFNLRDGQDPHAALAAFGDFSEGYQASIERPQPLFRRRGFVSSDGMERA